MDVSRPKVHVVVMLMSVMAVLHLMRVVDFAFVVCAPRINAESVFTTDLPKR